MASLLDLVTFRAFHPVRIDGGLYELPLAHEFLGAIPNSQGFALSDRAAVSALDTAMETLADEIDGSLGDEAAEDVLEDDAIDMVGLSLKSRGLPKPYGKARWVEFSMPEILAEYAPFPDMAGRIGCLMLPIRGEANGRLAVFVQRGEGGVIALPVDMRFDRQGSIVLGDDEGVTESPTVERFVLLSACLAADALESMEAGLTPRLGKGSLEHPLVTLDEPPRSAEASEQMHLGWLAIADGTREFYGVIPMLTPADPMKTLGLHRKMVEQAIRASRTAIRDATGRDPGDLPALLEFMLDSETPGNPENFFPMSLVSWAGYEVVGIARSPGGQVTWRGFADLLPDHGNDVQEELQSWLRERRNEFGQELASAPRPGHS